MIFRPSKVTPVVHLDRLDKARMIDRVLADYRRGQVSGLSILDVGCGNGDISAYFAQRNFLFAVDVFDRRRDQNRTFGFRLVDSELLPHEDASFDIVISHHVIEHVENQALHLAEIRRVLRPGGFAYLATPNRSSPFMRGHVGNKRVLRYGSMASLFRQHGFTVSEYTVRMLRNPTQFALSFTGGRLVPSFLLMALRPIIPSHVFILDPH